MPGHWTDLFSFVTGAIRSPNLGYLILSNDEAAAKKIPLAGIVQWKPAEWADGGQVKWRAAGAAVVRLPIEQLCLVGEFGQVLLVGSGDRHEESVGRGQDVPKNRGPLRGVRAIGEHVYCVGMDRQVYRRDVQGRWTGMEKGLPKSNVEEVVGFEAVDGFSEQDIYAVGWEGEIFSYDGKAWTKRNSPVNVVLIDVCCAADGWVYACGRNGTLLKGRADVWDKLDLGAFGDDIWSVVWYGDRLYLATMENVLMLADDGLRVVTMGKEPVRTCYDLVVGAGLLWSIGAKDVMSFDGKGWSRID